MRFGTVLLLGLTYGVTPLPHVIHSNPPEACAFIGDPRWVKLISNASLIDLRDKMPTLIAPSVPGSGQLDEVGPALLV